MNKSGEAILGRLRSTSRARGTATQHLLSRWVAERFLARLSSSSHAPRLILKGGNLFTLWTGDLYRSTSDVDLHGDEADAASMRDMLLGMASDNPDIEDATSFDVSAARFKTLVGGRVPGLRMQIPAVVGSARVPLNVDLGFGHPITPGVDMAWFPSLLPGYPSFELRAYPRETVVAEKLATMVEFGEDGTRLRDYYDVWFLAQRFGFSGHLLAEAVKATFARRDAGRMLERTDGYWERAFAPEFATSRRVRAWGDWVLEHAPLSRPPPFEQVVAAAAAFGCPLLAAVQRGEEVHERWSAGDGWAPCYVSIPSRALKKEAPTPSRGGSGVARPANLRHHGSASNERAWSEAPASVPGPATAP